MKGTDLTFKQLAAAEEFLVHTQRRPLNGTKPSHDQIFPMKWGDVISIVAWYGAIRAASVADGIGTVEEPAPLGSKSEKG